MNERQVLLVPHPGVERLPRRGSTYVDWPDSDRHRRKFLRVEGAWRGRGDVRGFGPLYFWGEFEAPTSFERLPYVSSAHPKGIQTIELSPERPTLNTDPWIFHRGFVWSVCRHTQLDGWGTAAPGDIVLFGSVKGKRWLLDTVLVVEDRCKGPPVLGMFGEGYERLVMPTLIRRRVRPFWGREFSSLQQPFSFVPCSNERPFARPDISELLERLTKRDGAPPPTNNSQALAICSTEHIHLFWEKLLQQIFEENLVLGISFELVLPTLPKGRQSARLGRYSIKPRDSGCG